MFISGPAGMGKTHAINAVRDFFEQRGQAQQFCVASYMAITAQFMLLLALMLNKKIKKVSLRFNGHVGRC